MTRPPVPDPIEQIVAEALDAAGLAWERGLGAPNGRNPDFYVPALDLYIEVKQFHAPRVLGQMAGLTNIIVIQGRQAAEAFARMIGPDQGQAVLQLMTDALRAFVSEHCAPAPVGEVEVRDLAARLADWSPWRRGLPQGAPGGPRFCGVDLAAALGAAGFRIDHLRLGGVERAVLRGLRWRGPGEAPVPPAAVPGEDADA